MNADSLESDSFGMNPVVQLAQMREREEHHEKYQPIAGNHRHRIGFGRLPERIQSTR
jgi:hypothetical protein